MLELRLVEVLVVALFPGKTRVRLDTVCTYIYDTGYCLARS